MPALIFLLFIFIVFGVVLFIWLFMMTKRSHTSVDHLIDEERRKRLRNETEDK